MQQLCAAADKALPRYAGSAGMVAQCTHGRAGQLAAVCDKAPILVRS